MKISASVLQAILIQKRIGFFPFVSETPLAPACPERRLARIAHAKKRTPQYHNTINPAVNSMVIALPFLPNV